MSQSTLVLTTLVVGVIAFGITTIARTWFVDNYEFHGLKIVNKYPNNKKA